MYDFWRRTFLLPRCALALAAVAAGLNVASYGGLAMRGRSHWILVVHLAVVALGFALFVRTTYHHGLSWRAPAVEHPQADVPRVLWLSVAGALAYLLVLFLGASAAGEGGAELRAGHEVWVVRDSAVRVLPPGSVAAFAAAELRVFSAAWLFFALSIAAAGHEVESRIRTYRATQRQAAA